MEFKAFWLGMTTEQRSCFAQKCGVSPDYLDHVSTGYRRASAGKLALKIEIESQGKVTRQDLRPDVFGPAEVTPASKAADWQRSWPSLTSKAAE